MTENDYPMITEHKHSVISCVAITASNLRLNHNIMWACI